jgi:protein tyrosine phosphatase type 4A
MSTVDLSLVSSARLNFLITDAPRDKSMSAFISTLQSHHCRVVVRACEAECDENPLAAAGIELTPLVFDDGTAPPDDVVTAWTALVQRVAAETGASVDNNKPAIAVHCIAGLGRSPVLVAIGLIELGATPLEAVQQVRRARAGAINQPQLRYLQAYKAKSRSSCDCCIVQ